MINEKPAQTAGSGRSLVDAQKPPRTVISARACVLIIVSLYSRDAVLGQTQVEPSSFNVCCWLIIISSTSYAIRNRAIIASIQPRFLSFYLGWTASAIDLLAMATCKADRLRSKHRCDRNNVRMLFC